MAVIAECTITLCDPLNPALGYRIRITDEYGCTILVADRDPSGADLLSYRDALRVADMYSYTPLRKLE